MYAIHTTPGFIIDSRPYGEAGKILSIFTRELGLVSVIAQGIRLEKSKLRYHAQEYRFGVFSLVRGKEYWRLTSSGAPLSVAGVSPLNPTRGIEEKSLGSFVARMALLLRRLLHGEEAHPELFDCVEGCVRFITARRLSFAKAPKGEHLAELTDEQSKTLESVTVFRILDLLGYIGKDSLFDEKLKSSGLSAELLDEMTGNRGVMNQHINKALRESHL